LLVALVLLTTALYVIEVEKYVPTVEANAVDSFDSYKPALKSTLISALANASSGGSTNILASDLAQLKDAFLSHSYNSMLTFDYSLKNSGGYTNGIRMDWGSSGSGTSAASAIFTFKSSNSMGNSAASYTVELSSQMQVSGSYIQQEEVKQVTLTVQVQNEGSPALAETFVFHYQNGAEWVTVDSPVIVDHGDGSYTVTFSAQTSQQGEPLTVSSLLLDRRGITVEANLTCNHT